MPSNAPLLSDESEELRHKILLKEDLENHQKRGYKPKIICL